DGKCRFGCVDDNSKPQDCNSLVDDGCETKTISDVDNCGGCGFKCPEVTIGLRRCRLGQCDGECLPPLTWCPDRRVCTDTSKDNNNCGACGNRCPAPPPAPPNMIYTCQGGKCAQLSCAMYFADCNNDIDPDGCEIDISSDPKNCGACGKAC